jgi:succinyl-diaminopimelate desuccinylase
MTDPVPILQALLRCPSVTPSEAGAQKVLADVLAPHGFHCEHLVFHEPETPDVDNLFARYGDGAPHFCFAGHSDVVPAGDDARWRYPPFAGAIAGGRVYGRGASDMKGSLAAFAAAAIDFVSGTGEKRKGSISLLVTGDEEGPAVNGTVKVLQWLKSRKQLPDHCLVGEPTSHRALGDQMKIGRRGSVTVAIAVEGKQGHTAYPHLADNPIPKLARLVDRLSNLKLDEGTAVFEPSTIAVSTFDVGNSASNVIPARASAVVNIRFNDAHSPAGVRERIEHEVEAVRRVTGGRFTTRYSEGADVFVTEPGPFVDLVSAAVRRATGLSPERSTSGGTSDARFVKQYCPVVEFGPLNATIHQTDENITIADLGLLKATYQAILEEYFAGPPGGIPVGSS